MPKETEPKSESTSEQAEATVAMTPVSMTPPKRGARSRAPVKSRDELDAMALAVAAKAQHVSQDAIVRAVQGHVDSQTLLKLIRIEIAKEAAGIEYHRQQIDAEGSAANSVATSYRRIQALLQLNFVEGEIQKLGGTTLDLRSDQFKRVMAIWVDALKEAAVEVLPPEHLNVFLNKLQSVLVGWEDRAEEALK